MLTHGVSAEMLKVSIPKDNRKSINSCDNHREIALISSISKLLDLIIIRKYGDLLNTCDLQGGFNSSMNTCTFMVRDNLILYKQ